MRKSCFRREKMNDDFRFFKYCGQLSTGEKVVVVSWRNGDQKLPLGSEEASLFFLKGFFRAGNKDFCSLQKGKN